MTIGRLGLGLGLRPKNDDGHIEFNFNGVLDPRLTHTRASGGTYFDSSGVLQTAGSGVARIPAHYYNGVSWVPGILLEEASTNELLQSRQYDTTWATGNNLTQDQTGIDGVANAAWTIEDDSAVAFELTNQAAATVVSNSQTSCGSLLVKKDSTAKTTRFGALRLGYSGGTATNLSLNFATDTGEINAKISSGSGAVAGSGAIDLGDWWLFWIAATNDASGNDTLTLTIFPAIGANADLNTEAASTTGSIIADNCQLEIGKSFPTSPIYTTTGTVTRVADATTETTINWLNQVAGTFLVTGQNWVQNSMVPVQVDDGGATDLIKMELGPSTIGKLDVTTTNSGDTDGSVTDIGTAVVDEAQYKAAFRYADDDVNGALDGTAGTADTSAALPTTDALTTMTIGPTNGIVESIIYWPYGQDDTQLGTLTS